MREDIDLAWCAGLFIGEGSVYRDSRNDAFHFSIGMLDHVAIEKFATILTQYYPVKGKFNKVSVSYNSHIKGGVFARIHLGGKPAETIALILLPFMEGTIKGEQIKRLLEGVD